MKELDEEDPFNEEDTCNAIAGTKPEHFFKFLQTFVLDEFEQERWLEHMITCPTCSVIHITNVQSAQTILTEWRKNDEQAHPSEE